MTTRRRTLSILLACALLLPVAAVAAGPASAVCTETWTSNQTSSKTLVNGAVTYTATVRYRLAMSTCNLGVYTKINITSFTNTFTHTGVDEGRGYLDEEGAVLKNCDGLTAGCVINRPTPLWIDTTDHLHPYAGSTVTGTRTDYPNVTFTYSSTAATWGLWRTYEGFYFKFVYQFRRNAIYMSPA